MSEPVTLFGATLTAEQAAQLDREHMTRVDQDAANASRYREERNLLQKEIQAVRDEYAKMTADNADTITRLEQQLNEVKNKLRAADERKPLSPLRIFKTPVASPSRPLPSIPVKSPSMTYAQTTAAPPPPPVFPPGPFAAAAAAARAWTGCCPGFCCCCWCCCGCCCCGGGCWVG